MPFDIGPLKVHCYQFPDDAKAGQADFLKMVANRNETWIRAYILTMKPLVAALVAAHQAGVKLHVYLDASMVAGAMEGISSARSAAEDLVGAGLEVTVGSSYAGKSYIMHEKGLVTGLGDCWEGSTNFTAKGWMETNTAMRFRSPDWRDRFVSSFNQNVEYAWATEHALQIMSEQPEASTPATTKRGQHGEGA